MFQAFQQQYRVEVERRERMQREAEQQRCAQRIRRSDKR